MDSVQSSLIPAGFMFVRFGNSFLFVWLLLPLALLPPYSLYASLPPSLLPTLSSLRYAPDAVIFLCKNGILPLSILLHPNWRMFASCGAVFLSILIIGMYNTYQELRRPPTEALTTTTAKSASAAKVQKSAAKSKKK